MAAAPNGETSCLRLGRYLRDWMKGWVKRRSSRRHWEHTEVEGVRVTISPAAERVRARMLRAEYGTTRYKKQESKWQCQELSIDIAQYIFERSERRRRVIEVSWRSARNKPASGKISSSGLHGPRAPTVQLREPSDNATYLGVTQGAVLEDNLYSVAT